MNTPLPITDWHAEFLAMQERYTVQDRQMLRLESKYLFIKQENEKLKERLAAYEQTRTGICLECGEAFDEKRTGRKKKYCCDACRQEHYRTNRLFRQSMLRNET